MSPGQKNAWVRLLRKLSSSKNGTTMHVMVLGGSMTVRRTVYGVGRQLGVSWPACQRIVCTYYPTET